MEEAFQYLVAGAEVKACDCQGREKVLCEYNV